MIISVDHGNKFLKLTGNRSFTSGLRESDDRISDRHNEGVANGS
jgi:radical SAM superfamily enzyme YgiQ (UPF0313 family)